MDIFAPESLETQCALLNGNHILCSQTNKIIQLINVMLFNN